MTENGDPEEAPPSSGEEQNVQLLVCVRQNEPSPSVTINCIINQNDGVLLLGEDPQASHDNESQRVEGPSKSFLLPFCQKGTVYKCYQALTGGTRSNAVSETAPGPPPLSGAPPSYSAVMQIATSSFPIRIQPSPPFVAPPPPPSYAEAQGYAAERPLMVASVEQMVWGPEPLSVVCPRCAHVVVTTTESHRSNLTHFSALALCLCGCWPCCLLPYCMDACKNTYHRCPTCRQYLGMYRPW